MSGARPRRKPGKHARRPGKPLRRRIRPQLAAGGRILALFLFTATIVGLVAAVYGPFLHAVLHTTPLTAADWAMILACSLAPVGVVELVKLARRAPGGVRTPPTPSEKL